MQEINDFIQDMRREAEALLDFAKIEEEIQKAVAAKRWEALESLILTLRKKSDEVNEAEDARLKSFGQLKIKLRLPETISFLRMLPVVPEQQRQELSEVYRNLKVAVYSVKSATLRLNYYFQSVSETLKKVLGELLPHRKGNLYSQSGKTTEPLSDNLIVNKSF